MPLYHHLGYFSILGLLRVHVLLGDYTLALGMLDGIDLNKKALFTRVTGAHVAVYYYVGFSYMMLGRYPDAIRAFSHILFFVLRLKHFQRGSQFDQVRSFRGCGGKRELMRGRTDQQDGRSHVLPPRHLPGALPHQGRRGYLDCDEGEVWRAARQDGSRRARSPLLPRRTES